MNDIFSITNTQKILSYMLHFPGEHLLAGEIQAKVKLSKGGVNQSLRELARTELIQREKKGKVYLYVINHSNPIVKQFKILKNVEFLYPMVKKLTPMAEKIVLFGSSSRGEDSFSSDIDLFVLARNAEVVYDTLKKYRSQRKVQLIARTPVDYIKMEQNEPVFYEEINRGITLWENKE